MLPTSTDVSVQASSKIPADADAVVLFVPSGARKIDAPELSAADRAAAERLLRAGIISGKSKEIGFDLVEDGKTRFRRVFVVGVGAPERADAETLRAAAGALARAFHKNNVTRAAILVPKLKSVDPATAADAIVTGLLLASFKYREYEGAAKKSADADDAKRRRTSLKLSIVAPSARDREVRDAVERAGIICDAQNFARTIASRPGNNINPLTLARVAQDLARAVQLDVRVLDEKQLTKLGMGGILGVGQGSANPPRLIVLQYRPGGIKAARARAKAGRKQRPLLIVGKSITFDTGGISIKPAEKMGEMIFDKCGGMAVLGLMCAVAQLKPPTPVVGILTSAENMPGPNAYRPGDILHMYNGVTVEVTNTDAEGRLVLGDALAWGCETYNPAAVVDLATLTGGCVVALGHTIAGVMTNNDELMTELQQAAERAGEKIWRLPVGDDQRDLIKSDAADIVNSAGRWGSPLQGGAFLSHFIPRDGSIPWAHLDIAGVADTEKELPYYAKGATGWGVRTLVEWVSMRASATL